MAIALDQSGASAALSIHRMRFLPFTPSAPTALALSPNPVGSTGRSLLAIGRQNGNIDLCTWVAGAEGSVPKGWVTHTTLISTGATSKKIESLAFAQTSSENYGPDRLRLFSISGGTLVTEHFLPEEFTFPGKVFSHQRSAGNHVLGSTRTLPSQGGVIWCMASSPLSRYIALGCEDGHVRIVDIREGRFEHLAISNAAKAGVGEAATRSDRAKTRIVSVAWGPPQHKQKQAKPKPYKTAARAASDSDSDSDSDDDDDDWSESYFIAGTTSSVALLFALSTGRLTQRLMLPKARSEQTIVWSVAVLPDHTLVTGDSLGFVTFYDAATKVPLPEGRFQVHDKGADVLCLTVGPDGKTIYSGSVDQKVSEFVMLNKKWIHTATRRLHAHDVKAVVVDPPLSPTKGSIDLKGIVPVLISASADFNIVLTPASPPSEINVRTHKVSRRKKSHLEAIADSAQNPISSNPLTTFSSTTQRRIPYVPQSNAGSALAGSGAGTLRVCSQRGWLVLRTDSAVEIWEIQAQTEHQNEGPAAGPNQNAAPYRQLLRMDMAKRKSKLISHAISSDGQFLAISDLSETKVFSLRVSLGELEPKLIKSFKTALQDTDAPPASSGMCFTPDGRLILSTWPDGIIYVVALDTKSACKIVKKWNIAQATNGKRAITGRLASQSKTNGAKKNGQGEDDDDVSSGSEEDEDDDEDSTSSAKSNQHRIDHLIVTPDSQYLVCCASNHIWTYNLDVLSPHPRLLPSLPCRPVGIACHPTEPGVAAAALQDGSLRILQWDEGLTSHARAKWDALASGVMAKIANVRDHPSGITWLSSAYGPLLVVHGATWLLTIREKEGSDVGSASGGVGHNKRRSRGMVQEEAEEKSAHANANAATSEEPESPYWTIKLTFRYQPLVHVAGIRPVGGQQGNGATANFPSLALVERPFFELAGSLDGAWKRERRYGQ